MVEILIILRAWRGKEMNKQYEIYDKQLKTGQQEKVKDRAREASRLKQPDVPQKWRD